MSKQISQRHRSSRANPRILLFESEPGLWAVDIDTPDYTDYSWYMDRFPSLSGLSLEQIESEISKRSINHE